MKKLKDNINMIDFLRTIAQCSGEVWFITSDGDQINLKSELSKYLFLTVSNSSKPNLLKLGELKIDKIDDLDLLTPYIKE